MAESRILGTVLRSLQQPARLFANAFGRCRDRIAGLSLATAALVLCGGCFDQGILKVPTGVSPIKPRVSADLPWTALRRIEPHEVTGQKLEFVGVSSEVGFDFTYRNGAAGNRLMSEATGGGCGWLDYDRDGNWDLYCGQGGVADADPQAPQPKDQLFRNVNGRFEDVTIAASIDEPLYGQGVCIGDFDNDAFDDVFVTNIGGNTLWRNQGDGTFLRWILDSSNHWQGWSSSAAWADLNQDGDLDLYVCNYVNFDPRSPIICRDPSGTQIQCQPNQVAPVPDQFFENLGDGIFREASALRGLYGDGNRALGVVVADFIGDERPEICVANDASANFLFASDESGRFEDVALRYGCALDANGRAQANMGVAVGDYDRNGRLDLYITHFEGEWNTLYANFGDEGFREATGEVGGVELTLPWVGFGVIWQDFDQDGNDELFVANGHIDDLGRSQVLAMPPQLLTFRDGRLYDVGAQASSYFQQVFVGRGCAEADFDGDGDFDLAVIHQNSAAELLENRSQRGHWLGIDFVGRRSNRRGIGARVTLRQGDRTLLQELVGGGSYCSSRQPRLIFGLGDNHDPCDLVVRWPSGTVQSLPSVRVDQVKVLIEPDE